MEAAARPETEETRIVCRSLWTPAEIPIWNSACGTVDSPSLSVRSASDETEGNKVRIIGSSLGRPIDWITQRDSNQRRGALLWLLGSISVSGQVGTRHVLLDFMTRLNGSLYCYSPGDRNHHSENLDNESVLRNPRPLSPSSGCLVGSTTLVYMGLEYLTR